MENKDYILWFCSINTLLPDRKDKLMQYYQSAENVYNAQKKELETLGCLTPEEINLLLEVQNERQIAYAWKQLKEKRISFCTTEEPEYPHRLLAIYDPPPGLFYIGRLPDVNAVTVAIVGARACSNYGKEQSYHFGQVLAQKGVQVVSGMARGIDSFAHGGALRGRGKTLAVLGCGADIVYPPEHDRIYHEILAEGGIISEYPPGTIPYRWNFPRRNRIISGLSDGVVVVEARKQSGSLITADLALEQGRDVFALPGRAGDSLSAGTNRLIKQGAALVDKPEDILEFYQLDFTKKSEKKDLSLETSEKIVYARLRLGEKHLDSLAQETGLGTGKLMEILLGLVEKGLAGQTGLYFHLTMSDRN